MLSFLPYITGIILVCVGVTFVGFKKQMKPGYHSSRRYFRGISFLIFCMLFFLYARQFNGFYTPQPVSQEIHTGSIKILYANIHKDNADYTGIKKIISDNDPDILMFVEFADHHYSHLQDLLKKEYPYTNNTTRSKTFVGSMVFSKYPLTNKADDFPQGARRYGYFALPYQGQQVYFYLVHTSSPDSYAHFVMRNEQLKTFVQDFQQHESDRKHNNIVVVGDFNITPWSSYYSLINDAFSGSLTNITKNIPFLFTRRLKELPLFFAHIDHLRTTSSLMVQNFDALTMPGSDHTAFLFTVEL